MTKTIYWIIAIVCIILTVFVFGTFKKSTNKPEVLQTLNNNTNQISAQKTIADPIDQATIRVTKKPFGIYIAPKTSPIQPEKFTGFHTGTDFETFPSEADLNVPFYAICTGKILQKRTATGYGGVLVESCTINNEPVTVVYGHIKLTSIIKNIGDDLSTGEKIGFLGQPPIETSGERKHLHLGIHLGTEINILGYAQKQSDLSEWLDFEKLYK